MAGREKDLQLEIERLKKSLEVVISEKTALLKEISRLKNELSYYQDKSKAADYTADSEIAPNVKIVIAGFVHSLKNQNATIGTITSLLMKRAYPREELAEKIRRIQNVSDYIRLLLGTLVSYLQVGEVAKTSVSVREILNETAELIRYKIPSHVQLRLEANTDYCPQVFGNKDQIEQVLISLFQNAIEAMPTGGSLTLKIMEAISEGKKFVKLTVEDTGMGIPSRNLDKIFDLNFSTKRAGWGMGLYLSKNILKDMGGDILIDSTEGKGTVVTLLLPVSTPI
ncbi:MAG TPA: HAMP domain-containing histidine kinase [Proteobacteria bacterium]|nr:HAMP domain-containing sensor histidine kinase [Desulfovibrionales bacterium]HEC99150.1 HAMP domain-containing histidine kinase [Pseudomonadota bacterium]